MPNIFSVVVASPSSFHGSLLSPLHSQKEVALFAANLTSTSGAVKKDWIGQAPVFLRLLLKLVSQLLSGKVISTDKLIEQSLL